jgi:hypothetical protein
MDNTG